MTRSRNEHRQDFVAHRCEGSLANYTSIRYYDRVCHWNVYRYEPDWDGNPNVYWRETLLESINVCPWCGVRLQPENVPF